MIDNQRNIDSSRMPTTGDRTSANDQSGKRNAGLPTISLPKGGGAIRGVGEKFAANPVTGTGSMSVPIAVTPGRSGFSPQLTLSYDSGSGNGPFGLGWNLSLPAITRKTDKGLPKYQDAEESEVFILSGAGSPVGRRTIQGRYERRRLCNPSQADLSFGSFIMLVYL